MNPLSLISGFYLFNAAAILLAASFPSARQALLLYGFRTTSASGSHAMTTRSKDPAKSPDSERPVLQKLTGPLVPHGWFVHFYVASVAFSLFWGFQFATSGRFLESVIDSYMAKHDLRPSMTIHQVLLVWSLLLIQGSRRLYESIVFMKESGSRMPTAHYVLGIFYYMATSIAIWIDGIPAIRVHGSLNPLNFDPAKVSLGNAAGVLLFILASGIQYDCHHYLASLKKYTLPEHPIFNTAICPHYTAECLIYVAFALVAAPEGVLFNRTVLTTLFFVVVNLGATAESTRLWYEKKFGPESVKGKSRMIPFIY